MEFASPASPCQPLYADLFPGIQLSIKRDDLLHMTVSGNKFRKLKYPLQQVSQQKAAVLSMGGPWSNHIHALAYACASLGIPAKALIRGEQETAMLADCRAWGMEIQFVSRQNYRQLRASEGYWGQYVSQVNTIWIPEGGSDASALLGVAELVSEFSELPDYFCCACGTAATLAGIVLGLQGRAEVIGIPVLAQGEYLEAEVQRLLAENQAPAWRNYRLLCDQHLGGYAVVTPELREFCAELWRQTGLVCDPVYTGKALFALSKLARQGYFTEGARVCFVHTGGLQGLRGFVDWPGSTSLDQAGIASNNKLSV